MIVFIFFSAAISFLPGHWSLDLSIADAEAPRPPNLVSEMRIYCACLWLRFASTIDIVCVIAHCSAHGFTCHLDLCVSVIVAMATTIAIAIAIFFLHIFPSFLHPCFIFHSIVSWCVVSCLWKHKGKGYSLSLSLSLLLTLTLSSSSSSSSLLSPSFGVVVVVVLEDGGEGICSSEKLLGRGRQGM